jgi:DNA integrity scanning protein DisA with diadenylate cyclase activity
MFSFHKSYFTLTLLLFITEVLIGIYLHDSIIRPYGGDFLVVILIYCFVKSFVEAPAVPVALTVLVFAWLVEISQYFHLVSILGLQHSKIACIILGTSFSLTDLLAYTLGIILMLIIEKLKISLKEI